MSRRIRFAVDGTPVPKQSYRAVKGGGYTAPRVKAWAATVAEYAALAMRGTDMLEGPLSASLYFMLPTKRRVDCDNLSKNVLDAMNGIVYKDDTQIVHLVIDKVFDGGVGVIINVWEE